MGRAAEVFDAGRRPIQNTPSEELKKRQIACSQCMHGRGAPRTVAVFNSNEDTIELLRHYLEEAGFNTVAAHVPSIQRGETDLLDFVSRHSPAAIVYDVAPPLKESWTFAQMLRTTDAMKPTPVVYTTTNKAVLSRIVGDVETYEIVEKPYDFERVVQAVMEVLGETGAAPSRG